MVLVGKSTPNEPRYSMRPKLEQMLESTATPGVREAVPGPGAYFKSEAGEAVSDMTRYGNHSMAKQSNKWTDAHARPPSSPRLVDMAHTY